MTGPDDYEVGYGRPPKSAYFPKGRSANPEGRRRKPPATIAGIVESVLLSPVQGVRGEKGQGSTAFQLISLQLIVKVSQASKKGHAVLRKYQAFAADRPKIRFVKPDPDAYARLQAGDDPHGPPLKAKPSKKEKPAEPQTSEQRRRQWLDKRIAMMRAGREEPEVFKDMTDHEAAEMYQLCLHAPVTRPKKRWRKKPGGYLSASEIFEDVIYSPIALRQGGRELTVSRMEGTIRVLASKAITGHLASADMLMVLHKASVKDGDFYVPPKIVSR